MRFSAFGLFRFPNIQVIAQVCSSRTGLIISAGIAWNERISQLRIAIHNPDRDDYRAFDVIIRPNGWVYDAAIFDGSEDNCKVGKVPNKRPRLVIGENKEKCNQSNTL